MSPEGITECPGCGRTVFQTDEGWADDDNFSDTCREGLTHGDYIEDREKWMKELRRLMEGARHHG